MPFSLKLVRRPRSAKRMSETVRSEVRKALDSLADTSIQKLESDIKSWENKPKFAKNVRVSNKSWLMELGYDARTEAGKHYKWSDVGTGSRGGNKAYDIYPKHKKYLVFTYPPHVPKVLPIPPVPGLVKNGPPVLNRRKHVKAPGIYPRNFSKNLKETLSKRDQVGGFRSTIEAAIKRAFRKEGVIK
jgi:hypothetical protein